MSWNLYFLLFFQCVLGRLGPLRQKGKPAVAAAGLWSATAAPELRKQLLVSVLLFHFSRNFKKFANFMNQQILTNSTRPVLPWQSSNLPEGTRGTDPHCPCWPHPQSGNL